MIANEAYGNREEPWKGREQHILEGDEKYFVRNQLVICKELVSTSS